MVAGYSSVMSETGDITLTTVLTILIIMDITSNLLVIFVIKKNKDMRYAKSFVFLVNVLYSLFRMNKLFSNFVFTSEYMKDHTSELRRKI